MFVYPSISLTVCLIVSLSICSSDSQVIYRTVCLIIYLSYFLYLKLSICLFVSLLAYNTLCFNTFYG